MLISVGTDILIRRQVIFYCPYPLYLVYYSFFFLSIWIDKSQRIITLLDSVIGSGWCLYYFSNLCILSYLHIFQWIKYPILSCHSLYAIALDCETDSKWSTESVFCSNSLHTGFDPLLIMFAWYFLVGRFWSFAIVINLSVSAFNPILFSHQLVFTNRQSYFCVRIIHAEVFVL